MIMDRSVCPICGGGNLSKLSKRIYKCGSCDAAFSWNENILHITSTADIYKSAIESAIGAKIDRVVLYSFKTGKTIDL